MLFLSYVPRQDRRDVVMALKSIYQAPMADASAAGTEWFRGRHVGQEVFGYRADLAAAMGAGDLVLRLPARGAPDHVYHHCDREPQQPAPHRCLQQGIDHCPTE